MNWWWLINYDTLPFISYFSIGIGNTGHVFTWYQFGTKIAVLHTTTLQIFHGNWISIYSGVQELTESWLEVFFFLFSPPVFVWVWFWQDGLWKEVCDILLCLGGSKNKKERDSFFSDHQSDSIKGISLLGQYFPVIQTASKCYPRLDFFFYLNFIVWTLAKAQLRTQQRRVMPAHTESCRLIH